MEVNILEPIKYMALFILCLIVVYSIVRVITVGFYRSKLWFLEQRDSKRLQKNKGEKKNG